MNMVRYFVLIILLFGCSMGVGYAVDAMPPDPMMETTDAADSGDEELNALTVDPSESDGMDQASVTAVSADTPDASMSTQMEDTSQQQPDAFVESSTSNDMSISTSDASMASDGMTDAATIPPDASDLSNTSDPSDMSETSDVSSMSDEASQVSDEVADLAPQEEVEQSSETPMALTQQDMSLVAGDPTKRKELMDAAEEIERVVRQIVQRLEEHKSTWYTKYLALDKKMDDFYVEIGLGRGRLIEDIHDVVEAMVDEVLSGKSKSPKDDLQATVDEHKRDLRTLEEQVTKLGTEEQQLLTHLKQFSEKIDEAFDLALRIRTLSSELRGLEKDEAAQANGEQIKQHKASIEAVEKEVAETITKELDKVTASIEAQMSAARIQLQKLKEKGVDFAKKAQEMSADRQSEDRAREVLSSDRGRPAADEDMAALKKNSRKKRRNWFERLISGSYIEGAYYKTLSVLGYGYLLLTPVWKVFGWIRDGVVAAFQRIFGRSVERTEIEGLVSSEPLDDPVLERIRQERLESYRKVKALIEERRAISLKDRLLDRLEAERVMKLDKETDFMTEIDKSYARKDNELTWAALAKRFMWKFYASTRRGFVRLQQWFVGEKDWAQAK